MFLCVYRLFFCFVKGKANDEENTFEKPRFHFCKFVRNGSSAVKRTNFMRAFMIQSADQGRGIHPVWSKLRGVVWLYGHDNSVEKGYGHLNRPQSWQEKGRSLDSRKKQLSVENSYKNSLECIFSTCTQCTYMVLSHNKLKCRIRYWPQGPSHSLRHWRGDDTRRWVNASYFYKGSSE